MFGWLLQNKSEGYKFLFNEIIGKVKASLNCIIWQIYMAVCNNYSCFFLFVLQMQSLGAEHMARKFAIQRY